MANPKYPKPESAPNRQRLGNAASPLTTVRAAIKRVFRQNPKLLIAELSGMSAAHVNEILYRTFAQEHLIRVAEVVEAEARVRELEFRRIRAEMTKIIREQRGRNEALARGPCRESDGLRGRARVEARPVFCADCAGK